MFQHIPALGRSDVQNSAMRQHYYPEGGWGWVVVACTFLCNLLTTGLLLSGHGPCDNISVNNILISSRDTGARYYKLIFPSPAGP